MIYRFRSPYVNVDLTPEERAAVRKTTTFKQFHRVMRKKNVSVGLAAWEGLLMSCVNGDELPGRAFKGGRRAVILVVFFDYILKHMLKKHGEPPIDESQFESVLFDFNVVAEVGREAVLEHARQNLVRLFHLEPKPHVPLPELPRFDLFFGPR